jgi:hypothetical protein
MPSGQLIAFCPPLIVAAEAAWIPARLHLLKVSEPSLSQSHAFEWLSVWEEVLAGPMTI